MNVSLMCEVVEHDDGTYSVRLTISDMPSAHAANHVSAWLRQLLHDHVNDIPKAAKGSN